MRLNARRELERHDLITIIRPAGPRTTLLYRVKRTEPAPATVPALSLVVPRQQQEPMRPAAIWEGVGSCTIPGWAPVGAPNKKRETKKLPLQLQVPQAFSPEGGEPVPLPSEPAAQARMMDRVIRRAAELKKLA